MMNALTYLQLDADSVRQQLIATQTDLAAVQRVRDQMEHDLAVSREERTTHSREVCNKYIFLLTQIDRDV